MQGQHSHTSKPGNQSVEIVAFTSLKIGQKRDAEQSHV